MLQIITQQNVLYYVMAVICVLGALSQIVLRALYGQLLKDAVRTTNPKGKFIRQLRQRYQSGCRMKQGPINTKVFIRRNLMDYRFVGIGLHGWQRFGMVAGVLCLLCGGLGWYANGAFRNTVIGQSYLVSAVVTCGVILLMYGMVDNGYQRTCLETELLDSLDNTFLLHASSAEEAAFGRPEQQESTHMPEHEEKSGTVFQEKKERLSKRKAGVRESAASVVSMDMRDAKKEHDTEIVKQMSPDEQERVIREVLKEFLT